MITPPLYSPAEVLRLDRRPVLVSVPRARTVLFALLGLASLARAVPTEMKSLPAGFGWADSSRTTVLESELEFTNTVGKTWQSSNFAPIYVMEESKPVFFKVAHVLWDSATQEFSFVPVDAVGERAAWLLDLANAKNEVVDRAMTTKRSNDHYFASAVAAGPMTVVTDADGMAQLSGVITLAASRFQTHFPYAVEVASAASGQVTINNDVIVTDTSHLQQVTNLTLTYDQACNDCEKPGGEGQGLQVVNPEGSSLTILPDGGLFAVVNAGAATPLSWGGLQGEPIHEMAHPFPSGIFEASGNWLAGSLGGTPGEGPGRMLLTGWGMIHDTTTFVAERLGSIGYRAGNAAYPGINYECDSGGPFSATSKLAGSAYGPYVLAADSKYIVRYSGVTGRHNGAALAAGGAAVELYGFSTTLSEFGMTFVENAGYHSFAAPVSRVRGTISIGGPSDLLIPFKQMLFNCIGNITKIVPGDSFTQPILAYWQLPFEPVSLRFPIAGSCAGTTPVPLGIMMKVQAAHVTDPSLNDLPMFGEVGIWPDGQLVTMWDASDANPVAAKRNTGGITSRFPLPASIKLAGPGSEKFSFTPCEDAYLNTEQIAVKAGATGEDAVGPAAGFFNLAGLLDVPFFQDMMVHVHLSSKAALHPTIHLMGGWPAGGYQDASGGHYFNRAFFDERNQGWAGDSVEKYRNGSVIAYQPRAMQSWMGMAGFDNPVQWNPTRRVFSSTNSKEQDLFIFRAESDIPIITPRSTEIHFGASYSALPRISLANIAFNAIDDTHGLVQAFEDAALGPFREHLQASIDHVAEVVSDDAEKLISPAITRALTASDLNWPPEAGDPAAAALDAAMNIDAGGNPAAGAKHLLNAFGAGNPTSQPAVLAEIDSSLSEIEGVLDEFAGADAVLDKTFATQQLLGKLLSAVPGGIALPGNDLAVLWNKAQPNLDALKISALELKARIHELRVGLGGIGGWHPENMIAANFQALTGPLEAPMKTAIGQAHQAVADEIQRTIAQGHGFGDRSNDEWRALLRSELIHAFSSNSTLKRSIQQMTRNHLLVAESALRETIDQWFQTLNQTLREAVALTLGGIDQKLNSYMSGKLGAGQFDGYAHINGDTLREMRLNASMELHVPDTMALKGYLLIKDMQANGPKGCYGNAKSAYLIELGAEDVPLNYGAHTLHADLAAKFALINGLPGGFGGSFEMRGELDFKTFKINALKAAVMVSDSQDDNYVSGFADVEIKNYGLAGGIFLGRACSVEPIQMWDPLVADFLGSNRKFTGVYAYGEGRMPLVDYGCTFNVVAGVGLGAFFFTEGPEVGGRAHLEVKGEALCALSIKGDIDLVGSASADHGLRMKGTGKLKGKVGWCPCCVKFRKKVTINYANGEYSADY